MLENIFNRIESWIDKIRFRCRSVFDDAGERISDLSWAVFEPFGRFLGRTVVTTINRLASKPSDIRFFPIALLRKFGGLIVITSLYILVQIFVSVLGLLANLFGLRRGTEYSFKENFMSWLPLMILGLVFPLIERNDFYVGQGVLFCAFSLIIMGLNIIVGFTGQASIGHAAFVLIGGYISVIFHSKGWLGSPIFAFGPLIVGGIGAASIGALLGFPAARVKGPYLMLVTLALMLSITPLLGSKYLVNITLGYSGLYVLQPQVPSAIAFLSQPIWLYYHSLLLFIILFYGAHVLLRRSKIGRALATIRTGEERANVLGINVTLYKSLAFSLSAFYAGIGGGLLSLNTGLINVSSYGMMDSIEYLTAVVVGGLGSLFGSAIGGLFLTYHGLIAAKLSTLFGHGNSPIGGMHGLILILTVVLAPRGVAGQITQWLTAKSIVIPIRRIHRMDLYPDYDQEEELLAIGPLNLAEPAGANTGTANPFTLKSE